MSSEAPPGTEVDSSRPPAISKASTNVGGPGQRTKIVKNWSKQKSPTSKCDLCQQKAAKDGYMYKCGGCTTRICSDCGDDDGESSSAHKAIAADQIKEGCWCGFPSRFNPAFKDKVPKPAPPRAALAVKSPAVKSPPATRKRKRETKLSSPDDALTSTPPELAAETNSPAQQPEVEVAELDKEVPAEVPAKTRPTRRRTEPKEPAPPSPDSPEADAEITQPIKKAKTSKIEGPRAKSPNPVSTIIIGAGITGLFIALELAENAATKGVAHEFTVLEINSSFSALASGQCAGLIHSSGLDEQWQRIADVSIPVWDDILSDKAARKAAGYSSKALSLALADGEALANGNLKADPVSWIRDDVGLSCEQDRGVKGHLDTRKLAQWLYESCVDLGVKFWFDVRPTSIERDKASNITGIRVTRSDEANVRITPFPCSNIVIAAGPFTPNILRELFPERRLALESHVQIYQSIEIQGVEIPKTGKVCATVRVPDDDRFHGPAKLKAKQSKNKIEMSRCYKAEPTWPLTHEDALKTRLGRSEELRHLVAELLNLPGIDLRGKENISSQRVSMISTNPVIGKVPSWVVGGKGGSKKGDDIIAGVWLAYGFGNYGTTLAPGVARLMGQMMRGEETAVDTYDFAVTEMEATDGLVEGLPQPTKKADKGKGRARR